MSFAHWRDRVAIADSIKINDIGDGGGAWHVRTHDVKIWRAPACGPASPQRIRSRLEELPRKLPAGIPAEGLACFIWRPAFPRSAVARAAVPCVQALADWIAVPGRGEPRGLPEALARLIGLGPGLTPSGDDFLAGVLATLHRLGRREEADALWRLIEPLTPERTHPISISHLRAATRGGLSEALHAILHTLASDGDWPGLDCWPNLGHSSSWDALAGVATVLRASVSPSDGAIT
jgi:hypothetical protein